MSGAAGMGGVLCAGRLYCDLVFSDLPRLPVLGQEVFAGGLSLHAGGGAAITAAHLAGLGRAAHLAAFWPAPPFHATVAREVARAGIDTALCRDAEGGEPQITVALSGPEDRAFLTRRVGAAVPPVSAGELSGRGLAHLHIGELATLVSCPWLIPLARAAGLSLSLDCSWDDGVDAAAGQLIAQVDLFFPNEDEVAQLSALGLAPPFAPLTVVKRGARGAEAWAGGDRLARAGQVVPVVDTTGAGDAFNAGFLHCWLAGAPLPRCLAAGNARGAAAVQQRGGFAARTVAMDPA